VSIAVLDDLRAGIAFFTRIPAGGATVRQRNLMLAAPLVGAIVAGAAAAVGWLVELLVRAPGELPLAAAASMATMAYLTRGLHLDGLADTADGLGSARPADEALAVMHRADIGPFGVVTVVMTLLLQLAALLVLLPGGWAPVLIAVPAGRVALLPLCRPGLPAAPGSALGAWVAGSVRARTGMTAVLLWAGLAAGLCWATGALPAWAAAAAVLAAAGVGLAAGRTARRRLGGVTGDIMGAAVELGQTAALLVLVVGVR
jgi:adenosylcobinamide-GDP ribazoletransferase